MKNVLVIKEELGKEEEGEDIYFNLRSSVGKESLFSEDNLMELP